MKLADLSLKIAGVELKNPLIVTSGPCTNCLEKLKKAEKNGAGAVSTKLALPYRPPNDNSRWMVINDGIRREIDLWQPRGKGNKDSDPRLITSQAVQLIKAAKRETNLVIIGNFEGPGDYAADGIEKWGEMASELEAAGADMLELNAAPHITRYLMAGGLMPEFMCEIVKIVKKRVSIPVIAKMPMQERETLKAFSACGVDALTGPHGNQVRQQLATPPFIDIYNDGKSLAIGLSKGQGHHIVPFGARSPQRTVTNWWASVVYQTTKLPLIATGGYQKWQDVVESIMWGATAVGFQSLIMEQGFEVLQPMTKALEAYMNKQGYSHLTDFRGAALKYVTTEPIEYEPLAAKVNEEKCDGCMACTRIGHCIAISFSHEKKKAIVNQDKCISCAWCTWKCPKNAIILVSYPKPRLIEDFLVS